MPEPDESFPMKRPVPIPLYDFFRDPASNSYRISPDGRAVSCLKRWKGCLNLFIQADPLDKPKPVTCELDRDIEEYCWKGSYLIYKQNSGGEGGHHLYRLDPATGKTKDLTPFKGSSVNLIDDLAGISDDDLVIELNRGRQALPSVYRLSARSDNGEMERVAEHPDVREFGTIQRWIVDNVGRVRAAISIKGIDQCLLARPDENCRFQVARTMDFRQSINPYASLQFTADNNGIYAVSSLRANRDKAALVIIATDTGEEICCLYENRRVDVQDFYFSRQRKVVTHAIFYDSKPRTKALDRRTAEVFRALRRRLRSYAISVVGHDTVEEKFIVLASSDRMPGKRYLFDAPRGRLTELEKVAPWLKEKELARVRPIKFRSRDKLLIHGYLTFPPCGKHRDLPLVVNVHGGPELRDFWDYPLREGAEVQFLANRGYAVLQVNFRGSVGYGRSFWVKGFRQRGRAMQNDVTDGVRWLIRRRIADPNRIAIYGKSYGGYAALAGIAFPPEEYQYKAAIDYAGVSNWLTWLDEFLPDERPLLPQFYIKVGNPADDKEWLNAVAPALHAGEIKAPVFIAHGAQDTLAAKTQSDQMVSALIAAGSDLDIQYMVKQDEGHLFQKVENKIDFYRAMESFLAKHLR
jgi:dipeptidyl aminopeptidase/acylaminoacyl peptidase